MTYALKILTIAAAITLGGCMASSPLRPVQNNTQRVESNGFSVMPPRGENWFLEQRAYGVAFYKKPLMDQLSQTDSSTISVPRTFFVAISLMRPGAVNVSSSDAIQNEANRLIRDGLEDVRRLVYSSVTPLIRQGTDCVRYEAIYEEQGGPVTPGLIRVLRGGGLLCRHPTFTNQATHGTFSERYIKGAISSRDEDYVSEAQYVLNSLVFISSR
jgi:hypothetical protein